MIQTPLSSSYWPSDTSEEVFETTVGSVLRDAARRSASSAALVEAIPDKSLRRRWTYSELLEDSERGARALLGRFRPGERVAAWANNIPEWVVLEFACALANVTLVTINPRSAPARAGLRARSVAWGGHLLRPRIPRQPDGSEPGVGTPRAAGASRSPFLRRLEELLRVWLSLRTAAR